MTLDTNELREKAGGPITCARCSGSGQVGYQIPDECPDCGGSGRNWRYPGGAIARYYSGPLLSGRARTALSHIKETRG